MLRNIVCVLEMWFFNGYCLLESYLMIHQQMSLQLIKFWGLFIFKVLRSLIKCEHSFRTNKSVFGTGSPFLLKSSLVIRVEQSVSFQS